MKAMPDAWYQRLEQITSKPAPDVGDIPELVALYAMLTEATDEPEEEMEQIEGLVVYTIGAPAIPALLQLAKAKDWAVRGSALYMLIVFRPQKTAEIADTVQVALRDENETVRETARMLWDSLTT